jgi:hypothetical protein
MSTALAGKRVLNSRVNTHLQVTIDVDPGVVWLVQLCMLICTKWDVECNTV